MKIQINHIGKMEGHSDFLAEVLRGQVDSAKIITTEGSRLIEGIIVGRHYTEAPIITSRICGICPVVHALSSLKAIENAYDIKVSSQTVKLRKVMELAQIIHSHALHLFFLSLPDFFDIEDDIKFVRKYPKQTDCALRVRDWALKLIEVIGGRAVHPIAVEVGGFKVLPEQVEIDNLLDQFESVMKDAICLVNLVFKINFPKFKRKTTFVSLTNEKEYAIYDGDVSVFDGENEKIIKQNKYLKNIKEIEEPYRAAKSAKLDGEPFMVGALARLNINSAQLNPMAKKLFKSLKWKLPQYNTFENITAQAIEIIHAIEEIKGLLENLKIKPEKTAPVKPKAGLGIDAVEAPRGTLYHQYKLDSKGYITDCTIITPTVCMLKNLEQDIKAYIPEVMKLSAKKRSRKIRALIRAYDPCIACATH